MPPTLTGAGHGPFPDAGVPARCAVPVRKNARVSHSHDAIPSPYVALDRSDWARLRETRPLQLTDDDVVVGEGRQIRFLSFDEAASLPLTSSSSTILPAWSSASDRPVGAVDRHVGHRDP